MSDFCREDFEQRWESLRPVRRSARERARRSRSTRRRDPGQVANRARKPARPSPATARREHEYKRNGTQCLFACLNVQGGRRAGDAIEDPQPLQPDPLPRSPRGGGADRRRVSRSSLSPTTSRPAAPRKFTAGLRRTRVGASSSPQRTPRGSTRSRSSSRSSGDGCSSTASSPPSKTSPSRCSRSSRPTTRQPSPSSGLHGKVLEAFDNGLTKAPLERHCLIPLDISRSILPQDWPHTCWRVVRHKGLSC